MRTDILERRVEIEQWIAKRRPKAYICRELRCKPLTLEGYLIKMGLTYQGNMGAEGYKISPVRKDTRAYLHRDSFITSHKLKLRLLEDGLKKRQCERCNGRKWLDDPVPIELHHLNGDRFDNRLSNLQLLCPNCHALSDKHAGKGANRSQGHKI